jgi:hypothetical protein
MQLVRGDRDHAADAAAAAMMVPKAAHRPPNRGNSMTHPISAVETALPVNQQGPLETCLALVLLGTLPSLERYDDNA